MKIENVALRRKSNMTLITIGEGRKKREFGLQNLKDGSAVLHEGTYSRTKSLTTGRCTGGVFSRTMSHDFPSREEALAFCEAEAQ